MYQGELLSIDNIKDNAAMLKESSPDFKRMVDDIKTPEDLDRFIELSGKNNGNLLMDKLSRTRQEIIRKDTTQNTSELKELATQQKAASNAAAIK